MPVHLSIENEASLPDGGPLTYTITGKRGIDIGRDSYLDWTLPDPNRTVSGKHCEIRYRDGGYWLHDVSRNGTFLNRSTQRLQEACMLRSGDRIEIGHYIISVRIDDELGDPPQPERRIQAASASQYWDEAGDAAPPISRRDLRPPHELRPVQAEFSEWAIDVPPPVSEPADPYRAMSVPEFATSSSNGDMDWARGRPPVPATPEPSVPVPSPRRPIPAAPRQDPQPAGGGLDASGWPMPPMSPANQDPAAGRSPWDLPSDGAEPFGAAPIVHGSAAWESGEAALSSRQPLSLERPVLPRAATASDDRDLPRWTEPREEPRRAAPAFDDEPRGFVPAAAGPIPDTAPHAPPVGIGPDEFMARVAKGAGVPPELLAWRDAGEWAEEIGALLRLTSESLKQLLAARTEAKRVVRAGNYTTIEALDNNPLKFSPTIDIAMKTMLGKPTSGYLDARRTLEQSFKDLKVHEVKTYSAMQHAIRLMTEDLEPGAIEESSEGGSGLGGLLGSKKAKLWDIYAARWDTLTSPHEDGIVDAFLMFFAECYDGKGKG